MDVLVALATTLSYLYSCLATMLIMFILIGKNVEAIAKGRTCDALKKLVNMKASTAIVIHVSDHGDLLSEEVISSDLLQIGDLVKILPGHRVPSDGEIVYGKTSVNESMITGSHGE